MFTIFCRERGTLVFVSIVYPLHFFRYFVHNDAVLIVIQCHGYSIWVFVFLVVSQGLFRVLFYNNDNIFFILAKLDSLPIHSFPFHIILDSTFVKGESGCAPPYFAAIISITIIPSNVAAKQNAQIATILAIIIKFKIGGMITIRIGREIAIK